MNFDWIRTNTFHHSDFDDLNALVEAKQEAGVTINYPEKEPFAEKVQELLDSYQENELIYGLITRIREVE